MKLLAMILVLVCSVITTGCSTSAPQPVRGADGVLLNRIPGVNSIDIPSGLDNAPLSSSGKVW